MVHNMSIFPPRIRRPIIVSFSLPFETYFNLNLDKITLKKTMSKVENEKLSGKKRKRILESKDEEEKNGVPYPKRRKLVKNQPWKIMIKEYLESGEYYCWSLPVKYFNCVDIQVKELSIESKVIKFFDLMRFSIFKNNINFQNRKDLKKKFLKQLENFIIENAHIANIQGIMINDSEKDFQELIPYFKTQKYISFSSNFTHSNTSLYKLLKL